MDGRQGRKQIGMMAAKKVVEGRVLIPAEELADHFHGQDFAIRQNRLRPTLAQALPGQHGIHGVVDQAIGRYNECLQVYG